MLSPGVNMDDQMWQSCVKTAPYGGVSGWEEGLKYKSFNGLLWLKKPYWSD